MDENNMTAAGQTAPAAAQTEATAEAAGQTVTVDALRGAIERRQEQNMRRAAEQTAARWSHEADELTAQCPDFDLGAALKDDRFCALLRAGIDVRTAWFALHAQALLETACLRAGRSAEQRVSEHIRARGLRPVENGLGSGGAGIVVRPDVSRMSRADRAELASRAERGERVKLSLCPASRTSAGTGGACCARTATRTSARAATSCAPGHRHSCARWRVRSTHSAHRACSGRSAPDTQPSQPTTGPMCARRLPWP